MPFFVLHKVHYQDNYFKLTLIENNFYTHL